MPGHPKKRFAFFGDPDSPLFPHAMLWIEGDACVAPTKLCHLRYVGGRFQPAIKGISIRRGEACRGTPKNALRFLGTRPLSAFSGAHIRAKHASPLPRFGDQQSGA